MFIFVPNTKYDVALKDKLKRFIAAQAFLEKGMFVYYKLLRGKAFRKEITHRANLGIFQYKELSAPLPYAPTERVIDNNLYGYAEAVKQYAGITHDLKAYMEHGLFLGEIVHPDQFHWHFPKVITMSQKRVAVLRDKLPQKEALAIGPYIHYATPHVGPGEMKALKESLGTVLLVFPFHSMKGVEAGFEEGLLIEEIKKRAADFNTVLISLYFLDAQNPQRLQPYLDAGFKVVTAGHKFDPYFVRRQRTHIELADMTMSNGMGTQTGYCIYLKKPHYIFNQLIAQKAKNSAEAARHQITHATTREKVAAERALFGALFGTYQTHISEEQRSTTAAYWGFEDIRTSDEIRKLFKA
jgi:hypothetical protein